MDIRPATAADRSAITRLMAPEIARGTLLPRAVDPADFLVATRGSEILGAVALSAWSDEVVELGALVAGPRGLGIGAALVEAAVSEACNKGYTEIVALTSLVSFFERAGFRRLGAAPWALARGCATLPEGRHLDQAIASKARICAACDRLGACAQALMALPLAAPLRVAA